MSNIGMPNIDVVFKSLATLLIEKSSKGVVMLIVKDDSDQTFDFVEYKAEKEIDKAKFTAANAKYISDCFKGSPSKVIVARMDVDGILADLLELVKTKKFNWIGAAEGSSSDQDEITSWVKDINASSKKVVKALVYNVASADDMHIVNFTNEKVKENGQTEKTGDKYISRLLGVFAGLAFTKSATYYKLSELESVVEKSDLDAEINAGKLHLFNDEGEVKIARAVNSLVTITENNSRDMKKITIVEALDLIKEDITKVFKERYVGKYKNKYDNQILFLSAINTYFRQLEKDDVLNPDADNVAFIDVELQREAWILGGNALAETWSDIQIKNQPFESNVYLGANIKVLDAIEDLKFNITI